MSENAAVIVATPKKSYKKIVVIALSLIVLLLVYGAGFIGLPVTILTQVRDRDCNAILSWNRIYTSLYPRLIRDASLSAPVGDCAAYVSATTKEANGKWQEAFDAYQGYSNTYPGGMYNKETHEHAARMLMNIVKDQFKVADYGNVITNLNRIVSEFSETSVSAEAWTMFPAVYTSWGTDLREAGSFEVSERIFHDFETWGQTNQKSDLQVEAQRGLAETFLAWGLSLQSQKQYENALIKFDQAIAADPQSQSESTEQVKSGQRKVYVEWGNELLAQSQYDAAVTKFQLAVSHAEGKNDDGAADALANGHIQWANDLSKNEDFLAALEHLKTAKEAAFTDDMKQSVDSAFSETYLAFSKSSGPQARRAMKDALKAVCEKHVTPDLPIFGLNKDLVRLGIFGVEETLPENLTAKTPGEMHYVTCVQVQRKTISTDIKEVVYRAPGGAETWASVYFYRYRKQVNWNISLRKSDTDEEVATMLFEGLMPKSPKAWTTLQNETDEGAPSNIEVVVKWLQSVIR